MRLNKKQGSKGRRSIPIQRERVNGRREENGARDLYGRRKIRRRRIWVSVNTPCCVATIDHCFGLHITEPNRTDLSFIGIRLGLLKYGLITKRAL